MKKIINKIKLKWEVFGLVFLLSMLIVVVFCLFQIFMLEGFYRRNKLKTIDSVIVDVKKEIPFDDLNNASAWNEVITIASEKELGVYLFKDNGEVIKSVGTGMYYNNFLNIDDFIDIINKANKVGLDSFFITFEHYIPTPHNTYYPAVTKDFIASADSSIVKAMFVTMNNVRYMLVVDARLAPVSPAVDTMKQQLLYITLIVVILSFGVSLLISNIISSPIKKINDTASLLARGDTKVSFDGDGYKEITSLNETLNYMVDQLNKTDVLQKELLANISHDLKTPLTLINGYAQMMKDLPDEITKENLDVIIEETDRLNILVNDLLSLSRLQAKTERFNMQSFNLTQSIKEFCVRQNKLFEPKGFKVNFYYEEEVTITGDENKLMQVLANFISNGVNHSKDIKQIDVKQIVKNNICTISVTDYGEGIKEDELDFIWQRYYKIDKTHKRSTVGSGLGLSIVKEILCYHNYKYGVISKEKEGSTFYFEIPKE